MFKTMINEKKVEISRKMKNFVKVKQCSSPFDWMNYFDK